MSEDWEEHNNVPYALYFSAIVLSTFSNYITPWILATRFYLIYFKVQWTQSTLNKQWKIHINPIDIEKDWYLTHKSTFGNAKYLTIRTLSISIILCFISIALRILDLRSEVPVFRLITGIAFIIVPLIFMIIIGCKMRQFVDLFYIMKEFRAIQILIYVHISIWFILYLFVPAIPGMNAYYSAWIASIVSTIMSCTFVVLQTIYILRVVKLDKDEDGGSIFLRLQSDTVKDEDRLTEMIRRNTRAGTETEPSDITNTNTNTISTSEHDMKPRQSVVHEKVANMCDTVKNFETFELLMAHMAKEWSMELLLAFIEFTQFQMCVYNEYHSEYGSQMKFTSLQEALLSNDDIPKSYIVHHDKMEELMADEGIKLKYGITDFTSINTMNVLKIRSYALYNKYVIKSADLQINISYEHRKALYDVMDDMDVYIGSINISEVELFNLYSDCITELTKLLGHSHYRFCGVAN